ncbi:MAG: hypothetical protein ACRD2A_13270, partial [Vicinamibacterales bacterium]
MANPPLPPGDDRTIPDAATLWRRIHPDWWVLDKKTGNRRLSTAAFDNAPDGSPMSVGLADEMPGTEALLAGYEGYGVAAFTASVRCRAQMRGRDGSCACGSRDPLIQRNLVAESGTLRLESGQGRDVLQRVVADEWPDLKEPE